MVRSRKETTISIRKLIIFLHSSGKSVRNVAKLVNLSHSTGQYVIKRFKEENRIENKVRKGRPAMLTQRDKRFIIRKFVKNPSLSALKVSAVFNDKFSTTISPETVRRVLRAAGVNGRSTRRKFLLVRKKGNSCFPSQNKVLSFAVTYGGRGALVWECMSASGLDNDPMHTALNVRLWCLYNCPQNLKTPPQSPDLNPIEHIWRELESTQICTFNETGLWMTAKNSRKESLRHQQRRSDAFLASLCLTRAEDGSGIEILLTAMGLKRFRTFALPLDSTIKARRIQAKEQLISYLK
ncbi:hypothetical protein AVEN_22027-1 [Araneus ventricosus]|uniref:Transposase Tc1-like domain-containing protein n=1 Tax=Araneus ventricosus TaxID=182803 RepID=A0A4Y2J4A6_ARAVE|nr:hypothetical protein AVEN_22027-1 [Araneus ventricosus]